MKDDDRLAVAALLFDADAPGEEAMRLRLAAAGLEARDAPPSPMDEWALVVDHPTWGLARIVGPKAEAQAHLLPPAPIVAGSPDLAGEERREVRRAQGVVAVLLPEPARPGLEVLRLRKRLLRFAQAGLGADGLGAWDLDAQQLWSPQELDDELAHDADLSVEKVHCLHAVSDGDRCTWLHSHGLAELGAFDFDVVNPCRDLLGARTNALPALALAILEGSVEPTTRRYALAHGGDVRFVPAADFDRQVLDEDRGGRTTDSVAGHVDRRAVVCEPVGWFGRFIGLCEPSRFLSNDLEDGTMFFLSARATEVLADRARRTFGVATRLLGELAPVVGPLLVKLGYDTTRGGREHLWFEVHGVKGDRLDATLGNQPYDVPALTKGARGEHDVARVGDWMLGSPLGMISPRSQAAARRVRARFDELRAAAEAEGR